LLPINAMPNGEFKSFRKTERVSATPSPSLSRTRVMRFALGTAAPARFMAMPTNQPRMPPLSSFGGALDSAISTSPFGRT
jgi:hypothetical protein